MFKLFSYLRRGHAVYTSLAIGIFNFIAVQYKLVISDIPWLADVFPNITVFGLVLGAIYVPVVVALGWFDFYKGSMKTDCAAVAKNNPYSRDMAKAISLLAEGQGPQAAELMRKWH